MASDVKEAGGRTRLFVTVSLETGDVVSLDEGQSHLLRHVLRAKIGDRVLLFNGRDGEWQSEISATAKRGVTVTIRAKTAAQTDVPDIWLAFAPVKKMPSDYLTQKATELGASSVKDMGRVMAAMKERHAGQLDMSKASALVKARLAG